MGRKVNGGPGNDTLVGSSGDDRIYGKGGNDELHGLAGADLLDGGDGDDVLDGGAGADTLVGGLGHDTASYGSASAAVTLDLLSGQHSGDAAGDSFSSIEAFRLSAWNDGFVGSHSRDVVAGGGGNDELIGNDGDDSLAGGDGNDLLEGGEGADALDGGGGSDSATYRNAAAAVALDFVTGIHGGEAAGDTFTGMEAFELSGHDDSFIGSGGADNVSGGGGNDSVYGGDGNDTLSGGDGNDSLAGGEGADALDGGAGSDTATYRNATAAVALNFSTGMHGGEAAGDSFASIEAFELSGHGDSFIGSGGVDNVSGLAGNDVLAGGAGDDRVDGGDGDDVLRGGAGADALIGGNGIDTADYSDATAAATINLRTGVNSGAAAGDSYSSIERFALTSLADTFTGDTTAVTVFGGGGRDFLTGSDGNDVLDGGGDHDILVGGAGADHFIGGAGNDLVSYFSATQSLRIDLAAGTATGAAAGDTYTGVEMWSLSPFADTFYGSEGWEQIEGGDGNDFLDGRGGDDVLIGGRGNDFLQGGYGNDILLDHFGNDELNGGHGDDLLNGGAGDDNLGGGEGRDRLFGDEGNDLLLGQDDNDEILGHDGDDTIYGGDGNDTIWSGRNSGDGRGDIMDGGAGADTFVFDSADWSPNTSRSVITGFNSSEDKVDLSLFASGGRVLVTSVVDMEYGPSTLVQVDVDNNGTFEFGLLVQGVHSPLGNWLVTSRSASGASASPTETLPASVEFTPETGYYLTGDPLFL